MLLILNLLHDLTRLNLGTSVIQDVSEAILMPFGSLFKGCFDIIPNQPLTSGYACYHVATAPYNASWPGCSMLVRLPGIP